MLSLFEKTTFGCSKLITEHYSTSFSLGIKTLHPSIRPAIYAIYGFVRYADEIVDTFHNYEKETLLNEFEQETHIAIERKISLNPVLHSYQKVVNEYAIEAELTTAFLKSMRMDLSETEHTAESYAEYIYGSAEVVGLMCLRVFCNNDAALYNKLLPSARALGAAFQKVNFLRDIQSDFAERGRTYFPDVDFTAFGTKAKGQIEADIAADFDHALSGIKQLPEKARSGVFLAYRYYLELFKKIKSTPATTIQQERIRVQDSKKLLLLANTYMRNKLGML
jgi:phytoene/squalene synthetase